MVVGMYVWYVMQPLLVLVGVAFVVTQMIIPVLSESPMFPLFRRKKRRKPRSK